MKLLLGPLFGLVIVTGTLLLARFLQRRMEQKSASAKQRWEDVRTSIAESHQKANEDYALRRAATQYTQVEGMTTDSPFAMTSESSTFSQPSYSFGHSVSSYSPDSLSDSVPSPPSDSWSSPSPSSDGNGTGISPSSFPDASTFSNDSTSSSHSSSWLNSDSTSWSSE